MSRQSKNARNRMVAASFKKAKGKGNPVSTGNRGPSQTTPKHGKKNAWFQKFKSHGDYMDSLKKGGKKPSRKETAEETV